MKYTDRGVSADKSEVHNAVAAEDPGLFPTAFCKILPDYLTGDPDYCLLAHADGAGTKSILAYLMYRETGDVSFFQGIAQDALVMNLDDMLCAGASGPFVLVNTIDRNAKKIPGSILAEILNGYRHAIETLGASGVEIIPAGGETADMGDTVRTIAVNCTLTCRAKRSDILDMSAMKPGLDIIGLASFGTTSWEKNENSGVGSNGLTALRHELLSPYYRDEFSESFSPEIMELAYTGKFRLQDPLAGSSLTVGEALLSPTRSFAPFLVQLFHELGREKIAGIVHNTGGGLTKCIRFGNSIRYIKDSLFDPPPLFRLMLKESRMGSHELFRVLNMGQRMEVFCEPAFTPEILALADKMGLGAKKIGFTEPSSGKNEVVLSWGGGKEVYCQE